MPATQDAAALSDMYDNAHAAEQASEGAAAGSSTDQAGTVDQGNGLRTLTTRASSVITVSA